MLLVVDIVGIDRIAVGTAAVVPVETVGIVAVVFVEEVADVAAAAVAVAVLCCDIFDRVAVGSDCSVVAVAAVVAVPVGGRMAFDTFVHSLKEVVDMGFDKVIDTAVDLDC